MLSRVQIVTRDNLQIHRRAKDHFDAGWPIIPLVAEGKTPLNPGGCNAPITTWSKFASYIAEHPRLNYGIVTGAGSGLVVVDIDGELGDASLRQLEAECRPLPETICVLTGKGRHLYFYSNNSELRNKIAWRPGIDVRANGGYVVGSGSIHSSGARY